jgi:hypothetical protein
MTERPPENVLKDKLTAALKKVSVSKNGPAKEAEYFQAFEQLVKSGYRTRLREKYRP